MAVRQPLKRRNRGRVQIFTLLAGLVLLGLVGLCTACGPRYGGNEGQKTEIRVQGQWDVGMETGGTR